MTKYCLSAKDGHTHSDTCIFLYVCIKEKKKIQPQHYLKRVEYFVNPYGGITEH